MSQAMTGGGDYDRHSEGQFRDAMSQADLVATAAEAVAGDGDRRGVVVADYGCAQGRASVALVGVAIRRLRERCGEVPVHVVHNDLLANDWASLFDTLRSDTGYLATEVGPITPMTAAASFYQPVTPAGLVDLGMSFAAAQWLSRPGPPGTGSALYFDQLAGDARDAVAARAHADWTRFLDLRADELAPGGRLVVSLMGLGDGAQSAGRDVWRLVRGIVEELVAEGLVDADHLDDYVLPVYERTVEEIRRPFADDLGGRLVLEHVSLVDSVHPALDRYARDGDAETFAGDFVGFFRAFSEPSLRAGLALGDEAVAQLYGRLGQRLETSVPGFDFTVHVLTVVCAVA